MIGLIVIAIVAILVIGLVLKLAKVAIILALLVGGAVVVRNHLTQKRIK